VTKKLLNFGGNHLYNEKLYHINKLIESADKIQEIYIITNITGDAE